MFAKRESCAKTPNTWQKPHQLNSNKNKRLYKSLRSFSKFVHVQFKYLEWTSIVLQHDKCKKAWQAYKDIIMVFENAEHRTKSATIQKEKVHCVGT